MKTLFKQNHRLSTADAQFEVLNAPTSGGIVQEKFIDKVKNIGLYPMKPTTLDIFQINMGKMCNQVCKHCHVDAGPDRKEIMTRETMEQCLEAIKASGAHTVDLTGGAPEMNPDFRWFVEQLFALGKKVIVRCNLTIILANPKYNDLPEFFKKHQIEVVSSLPHFTASRTDAQRGDGVFDKSIKALQMLNEVGYGKEEGLVINLVYNPTGAFLPSDQMALENDYKKRLLSQFGIVFNQLFTITNIPISRYLEYLVVSGNLETYMDKLIAAFNPTAATNVMCRNTLSVGWDGYLYDCDFNQMLDLKLSGKAPKHLSEFNLKGWKERDIILDQHCYGCTAGAGSSCGGATT